MYLVIIGLRIHILKTVKRLSDCTQLKTLWGESEKKLHFKAGRSIETLQ